MGASTVATPSTPLPASVRFDQFELRAYERQLLFDGTPVPLGSRALDMLIALAERPGRLVGKSELLELVWPNLVVEENNLATQISALRKVLGGEVIATIPGRGYRFTAQLAVVDRHSPTGDAVAPGNSASSLPPKEALKTNLPAELTPLFGRVDDLAALNALVDAHRLVVIVGAGGMGKTLLAQHLLKGRAHRYPHGVCWIELAQASEPALLPTLIAASLAVKLGSGDPLEELAKALAALDLLVVLDNAEHLLESVAHVARTLLDAAPLLTLVVTSQAPLKLAWERVYRIESLSVPQGALPLAEALAFGAVSLFAERARQADARFDLTEQNVGAVIEICRALDGLALAIELAAARAPALGVQRLAGSMQERLRMLTTSRNRAAPRRQQTLRAALDWSWDLLEERERIVLRRLAVISGSADQMLMQQIAADDSIDAWSVLDAIEVLVERSLLAVAATPDESTSYRLLDSPRAYAFERLRAAGEEELVGRRHAEAMASRFDDHAATHQVQPMNRWLIAVEPDLDNGRAAVSWALARGDAELMLRIASVLCFALADWRHAERRAVMELCVLHLRPDMPTWLRERAWAAIAWSYVDSRNAKEGVEPARRAVEAARDMGDRSLLARDLLCLGILATAARDVEMAQQVLGECRSLVDPGWPSAGKLKLARLVVESRMARLEGNALDSLALARRRVAQVKEMQGDPLNSTSALIDSEIACGDYEAAIRTARTLLRDYEGSRKVVSVNFLQLNLCSALCAKGDVAEARRIARVGWANAVRFEHQAWWADYLAFIAATEGRLRDAARIAGFSDAIYSRNEDAREINEKTAVETARAMARAELGADLTNALEREGSLLRDGELEQIAFADADS